MCCLSRWSWRCCEGLMLADSVLQPPQGSNCEWSLTRGAGHARRERSLAVVNSHYPVKSSSSELNRNNYTAFLLVAKAVKATHHVKTFRKKDIVLQAQRTEWRKVYFYSTAPHRSLLLNLRLRPGLSGSYPYTVIHGTCVCARMCVCAQWSCGQV